MHKNVSIIVEKLRSFKKMHVFKVNKLVLSLIQSVVLMVNMYIYNIWVWESTFRLYEIEIRSQDFILEQKFKNSELVSIPFSYKYCSTQMTATM